jgi:ADP-ribosylglycohydrolase
MLGAIIGDIVGSRWEFSPTNEYNFEWLSDENGFTDDTICTVAVADALLKGRDFGESIHEWCNRYPHPMGGYGGRFAQWVHSDNPQPYGSYGNGSAMRVSPVAHWYEDLDEMLDAAAATALPSHNHDEGIKGAQTVALAIFKALSYHMYQEAPLHIDEILQECVEFSGYDINMPKASILNRFDETCQGTVPVALKIISMSTCFEDAVRLAVSLGADADTLGAIVGSIAEAIWGIPLKLRRQVEKYLPDDMQSVLHKFRMFRPYSYKPLIDTCFSGDDFSDVSWEVLYDMDGKEAYDEIMSKTKSEHERKRLLMAERAKARENW